MIMSERELGEIEHEISAVLKAAQENEEADWKFSTRVIGEFALNLIKDFRRSQSEVAEQAKEIEFLRQQLSITAEARDQWDGNYCDLRFEMDKLEAEVAELRERVGELQSLLSEIRAFAPELPEKGRMYLVPTSKFMYIDALPKAKPENQEQAVKEEYEALEVARLRERVGELEGALQKAEEYISANIALMYQRYDYLIPSGGLSEEKLRDELRTALSQAKLENQGGLWKNQR